jgi:hypothetical protein
VCETVAEQVRPAQPRGECNPILLLGRSIGAVDLVRREFADSTDARTMVTSKHGAPESARELRELRPDRRDWNLEHLEGSFTAFCSGRSGTRGPRSDAWRSKRYRRDRPRVQTFFREARCANEATLRVVADSFANEAAEPEIRS